jgi:hypothetical protein
MHKGGHEFFLGTCFEARFGIGSSHALHQVASKVEIIAKTPLREGITNQVAVESLRQAMRNLDVATGRPGFHLIMNSILYSCGQ